MFALHAQAVARISESVIRRSPTTKRWVTPSANAPYALKLRSPVRVRRPEDIDIRLSRKQAVQAKFELLRERRLHREPGYPIWVKLPATLRWLLLGNASFDLPRRGASIRTGNHRGWANFKNSQFFSREAAGNIPSGLFNLSFAIAICSSGLMFANGFSRRTRRLKPCGAWRRSCCRRDHANRRDRV